ncbi:unnamed protein product [Amoebophrya sp. A120]|nr:unnamed protein product [Amoebophrya sp. A120]|eukprot:GSA120T00005418001.1
MALTTAAAVGNFAGAAGDVGDTVHNIGQAESLSDLGSGLKGFADSMENAEKSMQDLNPILNQLAQAAGADKGGRSLEDTIPLCKPWYVMGAVENFQDYLLVLQKQLWRLHNLYPDAQVVNNAFLDSAKVELLIAPLAGKGMLNRVTKAEMDRVEQLRTFLDGDFGKSVKAGISGIEQFSGAHGSATSAKNGVSLGKVRSDAKLDIGYAKTKEEAASSDRPPLENEIEIDEPLALTYHDGNRFQGLKKVIVDTLENMKAALKDVHRASEPCRLSNF